MTDFKWTKHFTLPDTSLNKTWGDETLQIDFVGEYQEFDGEDTYCIPKGNHFVVLTISGIFMMCDTVFTYVICREGKFEIYNME